MSKQYVKPPKNKAVIIVAIILFMCIIATVLMITPLGGIISGFVEKQVQKYEFRYFPAIGKPESISVNGIKIEGEPVIRLYRYSGSTFCDEYRRKANVTVKLGEEILSGTYAGSARYFDGEIASSVVFEAVAEDKKWGRVTSGAINEENELRYLQYELSTSSKELSEEEREAISRDIANEYLGDLSGYSFSKIQHPKSVIKDENRSTIFIYAKYNGNLMLEDYVEVNFASYSNVVTVFLNSDDRESKPDINSEEAWEYICSRVYGVFEGNDTDQRRVECEKPYMVGLHKDSKGQWYVRGYVNVNYVYYATDDSAEKIEIHNEEFIVYLPENFQS